MPYSVYIAKPPAGGGYAENIYKIGKTTEPNVESRVMALNDAGSNYPTANGENWQLVDLFVFASDEQMGAFEGKMASILGAGADPKGTGATELFASASLDGDVLAAARSGIESLGGRGLLQSEHGVSLLEKLAELGTETLVDLLAGAVPLVGVGLAVWRGQRIYRWAQGMWQSSGDYRTPKRESQVRREFQRDYQLNWHLERLERADPGRGGQGG